MKRINTLCALLLAAMLIPNVASALSCPGVVNIAGYEIVVQTPVTAVADFIGANCTYTWIGGSKAPTRCWAGAAGSDHFFSAGWANTADRIAAGATGGCLFGCRGIGPIGTNSPSCFVRASDGLPVELMEFSVEE